MSGTDDDGERSRVSGGWNPVDALGLFARGLAMGAADVVPGVSGGTIAFISGIYERFIGALRSLTPRPLVLLLSGRAREAWSSLMGFEWRVLVPLFAGIVLAVVLFSRVITGLMEDAPGRTYAFFFGLIAASAWMPLARMKGFSWRHALALALAAVLAWVFVGMSAGPIRLVADEQEGADGSVVIYPGKLRSAEDLHAIEFTLGVRAEVEGMVPQTLALFDPNGVAAGVERLGGVRVVRLEGKEAAAEWIAGAPSLVVLHEERTNMLWIFCCGALAISAMILPGVSGSFLLLFLGQYHAVFSTIHACIGHVTGWLGREPGALEALSGQAWWRDFLFLGVFVAGVVVGLGVFSKAVSWLFARAHDITMAALTGMMVGALRVPGREVMSAAPGSGSAGGYWVWVVGVGAVGAVVVLGLHFADLALRRRGVLPCGD